VPSFGRSRIHVKRTKAVPAAKQLGRREMQPAGNTTAVDMREDITGGMDPTVMTRGVNKHDITRRMNTRWLVISLDGPVGLNIGASTRTNHNNSNAEVDSSKSYHHFISVGRGRAHGQHILLKAFNATTPAV